MAISNFPEFTIGPMPNAINGSTGIFAFDNITINAAGDRVAMIFRCPKSGVLDNFEWRTGSIANNPDNGLRLSFQSVVAGLPDGITDQFVDMLGPFVINTWQVPSGVMTHDGTPGGTKRTVVKGEWLACVIDFINFVTSDSLTVSMVSDSAASLNNQFIYVGNASTGVYAKDADYPVFALKYADGTYGQFDLFAVPITIQNTRTFNNTSTPDERALRFQLPISCRLTAIKLKIDLDGVAEIVVYDNLNNVLDTVALDPNFRFSAAVANGRIPLNTDLILLANAVYRVAIKPTSTVSITMYDLTVNSNALLQCYPGGAEFFGSSRTDAGAWTDSNVTRPLIELVFNGIEAGSGSGGEHSAVF